MRKFRFQRILAITAASAVLLCQPGITGLAQEAQALTEAFTTEAETSSEVPTEPVTEAPAPAPTEAVTEAPQPVTEAPAPQPVTEAPAPEPTEAPAPPEEKEEDGRKVYTIPLKRKRKKRSFPRPNRKSP